MVRAWSKRNTSPTVTRIATTLRSLLTVLMLLAFMAPLHLLSPVSSAAAAASTACATGGPASGAYTAQVCLTVSGKNSLTGNATLTTTISAVSGTMPAVPKVEGKIIKGVPTNSASSVLSDYAAPFTFTLPTARWTDGTYQLFSITTFADGTIVNSPFMQFTFANGVTVAPSSNGSWTPYSVGGSSVTIAAIGDGAGGLPGATAVGNLVTGWNPACSCTWAMSITPAAIQSI